jgi:hypothetical protein
VWRFACAEPFSGGDNASVRTAERQVGVSPSEDNLFMTLELVSAQATTDDPDAGRCPGTTIITGAPLARPHHESAAHRRGKN